METAKKTLDITSQSCARTGNPNLTKNYTTNDRMLRYRRIKEYFFMDTFLATKDAGKSSRGHKCCQLFVTDKGFVYVVPMKSQSKENILAAVKQFAKEVGSPEAIICDASDTEPFLVEPSQTFCNIESGSQVFLSHVSTAMRSCLAGLSLNKVLHGM